MKNIFFCVFLNFTCTTFIVAQDYVVTDQQKQYIQSLIDNYTQAREKKDTILLEHILASNLDQLVSSGT
jgi:hypothetical protein